MKKILALILAVTLVGSAAITGSAADANVTYSGDAGSFVFQPGSEYSLTDLFPNFKDAMPGDTLTQRIELRNNASNKVKVKVYMRSLGGHEISQEFLSQLNLRVEKVGDTVMFDATAEQTAQLTDWVCLGTLYSGGSVQLDVLLDVPTTLDNRFQNQVGYLDWEFMIEEYPIEPEDPKPPQTGDETPLTLYVGLLAGSAMILAVLIVLLAKKRKKDQFEA